MMQDKVQLSVILTTHARKAHFRDLLTKTTEFGIPGIEIIIINDAADIETSQFIHQTLNTANSDRIYLFEHESFTGRGNSLNEGLLESTAPLIWAPLQADRLNESLLSESIRKFKSDPAGIWVLDYALPKTPQDWINAATEGDLPLDSCLIWNRSVLKNSEFFFNQHLQNLHGAELALRLHQHNAWHQTDPFFVASENHPVHASSSDLREFIFSAIRITDDKKEQQVLTDLLKNMKSDESIAQTDEDYLVKARQLLMQGDANKSLDIVNKLLKKEPDHYEAFRIKIQSLEKLRRHVEAAELKHSLHQLEKRPRPQSELFKEEGDKKEPVKPKDITLSIVIPTTGRGKGLLENTLIHLEQITDPVSTELVVIDNASIDDTFEYLHQLEKENFLNINVITNPHNRGFGASVNQGLEAAKGKNILVIHNDLIPGENCIPGLVKVFKNHEDAGVAAPVIHSGDDVSDLPEEDVTEADVVDSCCFMVQKQSGIRFDEEYRLCHFDMEDFCFKVLDSGQKIYVSNQATASHQKGKTMDMMGMRLVPHLKWQNRKRYFEKWDGEPHFSMPNQGPHPDRFELLGMPENPLEPEPEWIHIVQDYLTDEIKTEILRTEWNQRELLTIVSALLIADERELLRTLEDRLDELDLPPALLILFVHYYFDKNIYSRCKHYLSKAGNSHPVFDLFRLKIHVADKETDQAAPILTKMLERYPASPDLFYLAAELYSQTGDKKEAESFRTMAAQLDPYRFSQEEDTIEFTL
jgi:GT2 family glycosyltransferase